MYYFRTNRGNLLGRKSTKYLICSKIVSGLWDLYWTGLWSISETFPLRPPRDKDPRRSTPDSEVKYHQKTFIWSQRQKTEEGSHLRSRAQRRLRPETSGLELPSEKDIYNTFSLITRKSFLLPILRQLDYSSIKVQGLKQKVGINYVKSTSTLS